MKLAFSTNAFKKYSLEESIHTIADVGYNGVEILCDLPHAYPPTLSESRITLIKNLIDNVQISVSNLNAFTLYALGDLYHPSWIETEREKRYLRINHTKNCIKLAKALGAKNISTEPGGPGPFGTGQRRRLLQIFISALDVILPVAKKERIKILIEPEPNLLIENSKQFLELMQDIDSRYVKLNFDVGHFFCVGEDLSKTIYKLVDYIEHFHIEDISQDRVHKHLQLGEGVIDFKSVFRTIHDIGFDGYVTVELYPYQDCPEYVARKSLDYLVHLAP